MQTTLAQDIAAYKEQINLGSIQNAYRGLLAFMMQLRTQFIKKHASGFTIGSMYQGYMDITYFPVTSDALKRKKLKVGIVLDHENMRFEIWLVGQTKNIQKQYWELLRASDYNKYPLTKTPQDAVIRHTVIADPDFDQLDDLQVSIEKGVMEFTKELEAAFAS